MAWSYRSDRRDELYGNQAGAGTVPTTKLPDAAGAVDATPDPAIYSASGAIVVKTHTGLITLGSAAAMTLAAPTTAQNGTDIRLTSTTAFAHTITATNLLNDGLTGAPHSTFTFGGFPGNSVELFAWNGLWQVLNVR